MAQNACNVSCGGCAELRQELAELRERVRELEAGRPIGAVPDCPTAPAADDQP